MMKLALKVVGYGADKIPDKVFDVIPGGYYKTKEAKRMAEDRQRSRSRRPRRRQAYSEPESDGEQSGYHSDFDGRRNHRRRRYSNDMDSRPSRRGDRYAASESYGRSDARPSAGAGVKDAYYGAQPSYGSGQYAPPQQVSPVRPATFFLANPC